MRNQPMKALVTSESSINEILTGYLFFTDFLTFYFEKIIDSQEVTKIAHRVLSSLHSASSRAAILCNCSTISKPGKWHCLTLLSTVYIK